MAFRYVVLGAGRQGVALAYDLIRAGEAASVVLADQDQTLAQRGVDRLHRLLPPSAADVEAHACHVDVPAEAAAVIKGADVVLSAVPYRFNVDLTDAAINAGASFCDLGGNTGVVREQLSRHEQAVAAGVSIAPDCGLAPGLGNILAAYGVSQMDEPRSVHVRCGGLPEKPIGPLGYKLVFNFQGLINEYSGEAEFLRDGNKISVPALGELEQIEFPTPLGMCEAAVTTGGTSTCAETFLGKLETYDYKTVRYPGHFAAVRAMFGLGCFDEEVELRDGSTIKPKRVMRKLFEEKLTFADVKDLVVLRVIVSGKHDGKDSTVQYDLFDRHNPATNLTAMERTTAFPAALVAHMQARKLVAPGARPLETCLPLEQYWKELKRHDINVKVTKR